jgi:nitroreductase
MEVFEAVKTILAVRQYEDKPVPADVIKKIVAAARLTGSSMNAQPWHFIVVDDRAMLQEIGRLCRYGSYVAQAPLAVVVVIEKSMFSVSDGSRAIQSMMLTAWEAGVGSNWVGFMGPDEIKPLLGIPEEMDVLAVVPFGYPVKTIGKGKKSRRPASEIIHMGRFGTPFEG